jgi:hypothetical protein
MGERGNVYRVLVGNVNVRGHLGDLRLEYRILLKLILKKYNGMA